MTELTAWPTMPSFGALAFGADWSGVSMLGRMVIVGKRLNSSEHILCRMVVTNHDEGCVGGWVGLVWFELIEWKVDVVDEEQYESSLAF